MAEATKTHKHSMYDSDPHFKIDPITRAVVNQSDKTTIMQYDHNSERFTFELPRYIEGHDMLLCDKVEVHYINIDASKRTENPGIYEADDFMVSPEAPNKDVLICSWLVSGNATQLAGPLNFVLIFKCTTGEDIDYQWHTDICQGMMVKAGINNGEVAIMDYTDILQQWYDRIFGTSDGILEQIEAAKIAAIKDVQDSVPDDYSEVLESVNAVNDDIYQLNRDKAGVIKVETGGKKTYVEDASSQPPVGLSIYGSSVQAGIPAPEALQSITSTMHPTVCKLGKNLLKDSKIPAKGSMRGYTCEYEGDGVFHIYGTFDTSSPDGGIQLSTTYLNIPIDDPNEYYTLSAEVLEGSIPFQIHPYIGLGDGDGGHFLNWFSLLLNSTIKPGTIISDSKNSVGLGDGNTTHLARFWIYGYNETMEALSGDFRLRIWIEKGNKNTGYEPCEEYEFITDMNLKGIPVSKGGNYTDSKGQQWISDEFDFNRGVYIQRVAVKTLDGNVNYKINSYQLGATGKYLFEYYFGEEVSQKESDFEALSDRFVWDQWGNFGAQVTEPRFYMTSGRVIFYLPEQTITTAEAFKEYMSTHPTTVFYQLAKPIETPITDDVLAEYKKLTLSDGCNIVYTRGQGDTGGDTYTKLTYSPDLEKYIATHGGSGGGANPYVIVNDFTTIEQIEECLVNKTPMYYKTSPGEFGEGDELALDMMMLPFVGRSTDSLYEFSAIFDYVSYTATFYKSGSGRCAWICGFTELVPVDDFGKIDSALDRIIAIQNTLIGGDA